MEFMVDGYDNRLKQTSQRLLFSKGSSELITASKLILCSSLFLRRFQLVSHEKDREIARLKTLFVQIKGPEPEKELKTGATPIMKLHYRFDETLSSCDLCERLLRHYDGLNLCNVSRMVHEARTQTFATRCTIMKDTTNRIWADN